MVRSHRSWFVAVVASAVLLVACGSGSSNKSSSGTTNGTGATPKTGASGGTPDPAGVLRYGQDLVNAFSDNFDPGKLQNDCANTELGLIMDGLTLSVGNDKVEGGVAQSWTVDNPNQITFKLKPGLKFTDGTPVDSEAVKAAIFHTKESPLRTSLSVIETIDTPDPTTVVFHLNKQQAGDVLWALTYLDGMVYSPASFPDAVTKPVGSGPFKLDKYQVGQLISLKANPDSDRAANYKVAGVDFIQVGTGPQALTALKNGAVDMIDLTPEAYPAAKSDKNIGIAVGKSLDYVTIQMRFNAPPFDNEKVRAAMEYAVDRDAINKVVFNGISEVADQVFPKGTAGYDPALAGVYKYDPAKAKKMLADAGITGDVNFDLVVIGGIPTFERIAPLLQNQMAKAGFKANLVRIQASAVLQEFYTKPTAQAIVSVNLTNGPALWNNYLNNFTSAGFIANVLGTARPEIVPLVAAANSPGSFDPSVIGPPMKQVSKLIMTEGLEIPIVFQPRMVAYDVNRVGGTVTAPIGSCRSNVEGVFIKKK